MAPLRNGSAAAAVGRLGDVQEDMQEDVQDGSTTRPLNPLIMASRGRRWDGAPKEPPMCHVWNRHSPEDLCSKGRWTRLRLMREMSLFSRDCSSERANVQLGELFRLEWAALKSEADLLSHSEHLRPGVGGRDCILIGAATGQESSRCVECFRRVDGALALVDAAYRAFDRTLQRFDCLPARDSASATRPFSPNGTCVDCKTWYRKWLLVQAADLWRVPPCINWCFYTQLACPHLATSRVVDFAGHPSFQCRDLNIPHSTGIGTSSAAAAVAARAKLVRSDLAASSCECIHPCDLHRADAADARPPAAGATTRRPNPLKGPHTAHHQPPRPHDFFASAEGCLARRQRCSDERRARAEYSEHAAYPTGATHSAAAARDGHALSRVGSAEQRRRHRHSRERVDVPQPLRHQRRHDPARAAPPGLMHSSGAAPHLARLLLAAAFFLWR